MATRRVDEHLDRFIVDGSEDMELLHDIPGHLLADRADDENLPGLDHVFHQRGAEASLQLGAIPVFLVIFHTASIKSHFAHCFSRGAR
ncbi:hypothetical protein D9M69_532950 [compost metagenome]